MGSDIFSAYQNILFDCDGVLLNSNAEKTKAFFKAVSKYGVKHAEALSRYHIQNGGISRYQKFQYFFESILKTVPTNAELKEVLDLYSKTVMSGLLRCEMAVGLPALRKLCGKTKWLVVSGGDQNELRYLFEERAMDTYFDGGIFGSPDSKEVIVARELARNNLTGRTLFLGDSKYDYRVAKKFGCDFVFVSEWSEVEEWQTWVAKNKIFHVRHLSDLLKLKNVQSGVGSGNSLCLLERYGDE